MNLLYLIIIILIILWALGYFGGFIQGDVIHVLLIIVLVLIVIKLAQGR